MEIWGSFNEKWKIKIKRTMRINEGKTGKKENYGMTQEKFKSIAIISAIY